LLVADISSSEVSPFRRRAAEALDPELRSAPGLSPINMAIIGLILLSITLGIIETEEQIVGENGAYFMAAEVVIFALFLIEYVLRIWSSIENPRYASRWEYARKPAPLLDLATLIVIGADLAGTQGFLLRLARLFRLFRLAKLGRFSDSWVMLGTALSQRRYELAMSVGLAIPLLVITSSLLYVAEGDVQPDEFGSIPRAMWWSIATLTTVGYGDVVPITVAGRILAALAAVAGVGLIAMPAGIIAGAFSEVIQERRRAAEAKDRKGGQ
jgi:voltage-gated potassium channel